MIDFLMISTRTSKRGVVEIYPKFIIKKSSDLMIRGGDFYAIWVEERGLWSTDEQDALFLIDMELEKYAEENRQLFSGGFKVLHMWDAESGMIDSWHKYCQKQMRDSFHMLDEKLIFSNTETGKKDYASRKLSYPLDDKEPAAWNRLMSVLYSPEEKHKIEWAIGSIVSGDSKKLQKFMVLYGAAGTGKSTVLNIIGQLFDGYVSVFDAKALGSSSNTFALEAFRTNPLVAIQHDGDLSHIEDNTRLNSLVSHEIMTVNEKFKSTYANRFKAFLFMGTNKPVKITDAKSGLIRRLVDVSPTGDKLDPHEYKQLMKQMSFELGAIANHCQEVYLEDPGAYDDYVPLSMLGASNDFYNFVMDAWYVFKKEDETTLKAAWEMYKNYCEDAKVSFPYSQRAFKEELKNYFKDYKDRVVQPDGTRIRSYYKGFRSEKFEAEDQESREKKREDTGVKKESWLVFKEQHSIFDDLCADCPAQYSTEPSSPGEKPKPFLTWDKATTKLRDLDTSRLHYVQVQPIQPVLIHVDFDQPDETGKKSFAKNLEEASKWPPTYAELSKSGEGIHLSYFYTGDPSKLSCVYDDHVEIKVPIGNSSLRRKLTKCNDLPIATISSGLPLKEDKKTVNFESIKNDKALITMIKRSLNKEYEPYKTVTSIDFIKKILDDAYANGLRYDLTAMRPDIMAFANNSTHNAAYCIKQVSKMKFKSEEPAAPTRDDTAQLVFFDVEVFPNLFLVNFKMQGKDKPVARLINPKPSDIDQLIRFNLVGFNCRRYDNHILYACLIGYDNAQLYDLSQKIIGGSSNCFFSEAYDLSYTDVYDFASAGNKQSLKKWEIALGIHHQELGLPWDQPVPEELWTKVAEYCDNDVIATEAVFDHLKGDWTARQILADLAGMTVNDTTNTLTTRIIFGNNRKPQSQFNYRDLSQPVKTLPTDVYNFLHKTLPEMMVGTHGPEASLLPYFPGYEYKNGVSMYRGTEIGEGGNVFAVPGMYWDAALLDVMSMHPFSTIAECLFGVEFTTRFQEIVDGRVSIKHEAWEIVNGMLDGKLTPYIQKVLDGEMTCGELANALKTAINSVYGLTAAGFDNPFRDPRNIDNIVAKRGALFMEDLKHAVWEKGFTVAHIKTDSIKIPNATPEIIQFVMDFGKRYGYTFEHEATYDRICLVNDAVYIARYKGGKKDGQWTATGTQFAVPYVFKRLFSHEELAFEDFCETKAVNTTIFLDLNEGLPDVSEYEEELKRRHADYTLVGVLRAKPKQELAHLTDDDLRELISKGHNYRFIGKVGSFCPMKPGCGGGMLVRETINAKTGAKGYAAVTGTKGYLWMEAEMVKELGKEADIDRSYYDKQVDAAVKSISQYGDFEWFVSKDPYIPDDQPPWDTTA